MAVEAQVNKSHKRRLFAAAAASAARVYHFSPPCNLSREGFSFRATLGRKGGGGATRFMEPSKTAVCVNPPFIPGCRTIAASEFCPGMPFIQSSLFRFGARVCGLGLIVAICTNLCWGGPAFSGQSAVAPAEAVRVDHAPQMDGTLGDPEWELSTPISDFRQSEPREGEEPSEKTEVRILYTRHAIYFGVRCFDKTPAGIVATELRRDVSQDLDDHFEILIDSNLDRRGGYVFQVNPLGTQIDGLVVEEQRSSDGEDFDRGWDGVWASEARIGADGWTATVEIPFTTLNFTHSTEVIWGVNFKRFIRRKNEEDLWSAYRRTFGLTKVSQAGELRGIRDIGSGRLFIVKPYTLGRYDKQTGQDLKFPLTGGVDVKYGLSSNVVLNLTGNTDFADTEVDLEPFNLTPFKVFIPEKRQFFLENAGVFDFELGDQDRLFFSRQIGIDPVTGNQVPINGGARLTGSVGRTELGIMEVDTRSSGPNPYGYYAVAWAQAALVGVMSNHDAAVVKRATPGVPTTLTPNGVDVDYFKAGDGHRESDSAIYMGDYKYFPNTDAVLYFVREIMPIIRQQRPAFTLTLIGKEPTPELMTLANNPSSGVHVAGLVEDTRAYLTHATLFVCPLRSGSGTRFKLLEALACGCPVVTTTLGCEGLEPTNGRHMLLADSPHAFAEAVLKLLNDPSEAERLGRHGRNWVTERHAWSRSAALLADAWDHLSGSDEQTVANPKSTGRLPDLDQRN